MSCTRTRILESYSHAISIAKEISTSAGVMVSVYRSADDKWTVKWWSNGEDAESAANPMPPGVGTDEIFWLTEDNHERAIFVEDSARSLGREYQKIMEEHGRLASSVFCHRCGGDGGALGNCPRCGGNGFEPSSSV